MYSWTHLSSCVSYYETAWLFYSTALRTVVSDEIANHLVFPNKITVPLMDQTGLASLLFRQPKVSSGLTHVLIYVDCRNWATFCPFLEILLQQIVESNFLAHTSLSKLTQPRSVLSVAPKYSNINNDDDYDDDGDNNLSSCIDWPDVVYCLLFAQP